MGSISEKEKSVFFCSAASRYFKEDIHGTASNYKGFVLLEYSDPFPEKISQCNYDKKFISQLEAVAKSRKAKLLLIRNRKSDYKVCRLMYVDCVRSRYTVIRSTVDEVTAIDLESYLQGDTVLWEDAPFFVICTNGKKDKCCSKFGFPVFKFFESFNADVGVWECTHVGGDRFAANVVAMPYGLYYGHVTVEDVGHIMVRTLLKKVYKNKYRGICTRSFLHQSVEYYLREHLQNFDVDFAISFNLVKTDEVNYTFQVTVPDTSIYEIVVEKNVIAYPHLITCKSSGPGTITKYLLTSLTRV